MFVEFRGVDLDLEEDRTECLREFRERMLYYSRKRRAQFLQIICICRLFDRPYGDYFLG